jgi:hypothetical protein
MPLSPLRGIQQGEPISPGRQPQQLLNYSILDNARCDLVVFSLPVLFQFVDLKP